MGLRRKQAGDDPETAKSHKVLGALLGAPPTILATRHGIFA